MSRAADVYSFSMIMWELFACKRLYEGHIASQVLSHLLPFEITHHEQHVWHMCLQSHLVWSSSSMLADVRVLWLSDWALQG